MKSQVLLVAEDDDNDAILLERALRKAGERFRMIRVTNGEELITYLKGEEPYADRRLHPLPQVLLLDLKMPVKDGFDVLAWLRDCQGDSRTPAVVFSSSTLRKDVERAYELGASSYVVKSTAPDRLERMVEALYEWWAVFNALPRAALR
jgi:CheY-like chemotaxis protein